MTTNSNAFHMRRKEKEITAPQAINNIIQGVKFCHLGFADKAEPYIVPVTFGYEDNHIYFHSAPAGRKVDLIKENNRVCFNIVTDVQPVDLNPKTCSMKYKSVTGIGTAHILTNPAEKIRGLKVIMRQSLGYERDFPLEKLDSTLVVRIDILEMKGKQAI